MHLPGMLEAAFVRSPHSHARIKGINISDALKHKGVCKIYTASDLPDYLRNTTVPFQVPNPAISQPFQQRLLEDREVCFAGEPIALVVADTRYNAEDAATLVQVDYDILPGAADCKSALEDSAPLCHVDSPNNEGAKYTVGYGDVASAFANAHLTHREEYWIHRGGGFAIENRGVVAQYDELDDVVTIWSATQSPFPGEAKRCRYAGLGIRQGPRYSAGCRWRVWPEDNLLCRGGIDPPRRQGPREAGKMD